MTAPVRRPRMEERTMFIQAVEEDIARRTTGSAVGPQLLDDGDGDGTEWAWVNMVRAEGEFPLTHSLGLIIDGWDEGWQSDGSSLTPESGGIAAPPGLYHVEMVITLEILFADSSVRLTIDQDAGPHGIYNGTTATPIELSFPSCHSDWVIKTTADTVFYPRATFFFPGTGGSVDLLYAQMTVTRKSGTQVF